MCTSCHNIKYLSLTINVNPIKIHVIQATKSQYYPIRVIFTGKYYVVVSHPAGDCGVAERLAHQVSQQRVGSQEAEPDVGGLGELPQHR